MTSSSLKLQFWKFFLPGFCNLRKYEWAKFHVNSNFLSGFRQVGRTMSPPRGMIRQKNPGADSVKYFAICSSAMAHLYQGIVTRYIYIKVQFLNREWYSRNCTNFASEDTWLESRLLTRLRWPSCQITIREMIKIGWVSLPLCQGLMRKK